MGRGSLNHEGRPLTSGEVAMLRAVYGNRIPYAEVRVVPHRWTWPFHNDRSMAPNGIMYMPGDDYRSDFASPSVNISHRSTFVHEATHLYQWYVLNQIVWLIGPFDRRYEYTLVPGKRWTDYGLEQMAMIAQDYFLLSHGARRTNGPRYPLSAYAGLLPAK